MHQDSYNSQCEGQIQDLPSIEGVGSTTHYEVQVGENNSYVSPIVEKTRAEISHVEKMRNELLERRAERMGFFMDVMRAQDGELAVSVDKHGRPIMPTFGERLRAAELAGKVDGDYVSRNINTEFSVATTYQEMISTRAGKMVEVIPAHRTAEENADYVLENLIEDDGAEEYED